MSDKQKLKEIRALCRKERDLFIEKSHVAADDLRYKPSGEQDRKTLVDFIKYHDRADVAETILWIAEGWE